MKSLDFSSYAESFFMKNTLITLIILGLVVVFGIVFSEGENNLEGWPIGLTSCPTPACDFQ